MGYTLADLLTPGARLVHSLGPRTRVAACEMSGVYLKRAYDPPSPDDSVRALVDRLWPRGLTRDTAKIALWQEEVTLERKYDFSC